MQNCIGWHKLTHAEWQTKKLIFEVKLKTDIAAMDLQKFVENNPSYKL